MEKLKKNYLGLPLFVSLAIGVISFILIMVGSFLDLDISKGMLNKTDGGAFFANYGGFISYFIYVFAGVLFFKAFKKKGNKKAAWGLLVLSYLVAMYFALHYFGPKMRDAFGYGTYNVWGPSILTIIYTFLLFAWIPPIAYFLIDDENPKLLIKIASLILIGGIIADGLNVFLKAFASRPRFNYVDSLNNDYMYYRAWWDFKPFSAANDNFKSFPSGNMTIATIACVMPLASRVFKYRFKFIEWVMFVLSLTYVILFGYNRIHMGAHYLSDVVFGVALTYGIYLLTYHILFKESDFKVEDPNLVLLKPKKEEKVVEAKQEEKVESGKNNSYKKGKADGKDEMLSEVIKNMNRGGLEAKRIAKLLKTDIIEVNEVLKKLDR